MKHALRVKAFTLLMSLAMVLLPAFGMGGAVYADDSEEEQFEPVTYMDWDEATGKLVEKTCTDYTPLENWYVREGRYLNLYEGNWYVLRNNVSFNNSEDGIINGRINVHGKVNLILMDGKTLDATQGIQVCIDRSGDEPVVGDLTIYGQAEGTGTINAKADDHWETHNSAIGGSGMHDNKTIEESLKYCDAGNITINGGIINAAGNSFGAAIGGGQCGDGGNVTINHGTVNAVGAFYKDTDFRVPAFGAGSVYLAKQTERGDEGTVTINKDLAVVAGDTEDDLAIVNDLDGFTQDHHAPCVHIGTPSYPTATFKVNKGKWNDGTTEDKTYRLKTCEGVAIKVPADQFPEVGDEPDTGYGKEGVWEPGQDTKIATDTSFRYTYSYEKNAPSMIMFSEVLGDACNTENAKTVVYGGNYWRVIGYKGEGVASIQPSMTLLSSKVMGETTFGKEGQEKYDYADSQLRTCIDEIANTLTDGEKSVVAGRTLEAGEYDGANTDCIAGEPVENALMWPLSTKEANMTNKALRAGDSTIDWWLRSPGQASQDVYHPERTLYPVAFAWDDGNVYAPGISVVFERSKGVRPAFNVAIGKILFTSAAEGGKVSGDEGPDALKEIGKTDSSSTWKLTIRDVNRGGFTAQPESVTDDSMTVKYDGAFTGENEYISAVIQDSKGIIKYYGRVKQCASEDDASGTVTINTADKIGEDDSLFVFNEQYNGDNKTDLTSLPIRCAMTYTWADDNSSVTAVCSLPDGSEVTETANTTSKVTKAPFCETEGERTYTAEFTDPAFTTQTKVVKMPATGHSWRTPTYTWSADNSNVTAKRVCSRDIRSHVEAEVVATTSETKPATCDEKGEITYTAVFHNEAFAPQMKVEYIDALGHDWSDWTVTVEATEEAAGEQVRTCLRTGQEDSMVIPPIGHVHSLVAVEGKEASCEESGNKPYYECSGCGAWFEDENGTTQVSGLDILLHATGHKKADPEIGEVTAPTCDSVGGYTYTIRCETCKKVVDVQHVTIDMLGHEWGEWEVTTPASATEEGVETRTCSRCGEAETRSLPKLESIDKAKVVLSTSVFTYNGKVQKPAIKTIGSNKLKADKDYTVKWSNDSPKNVGSYKVTITGIGNYAGVTEATFKINPKATKLKSVSALKKGFKAKWAKKTAQVTGYQIQYSTNSKFKSGNKTVTIGNNKTVSKKVTKLKAGKKYYVRVRTYKTVNGKKYWSAWSAKKSIKTR